MIIQPLNFSQTLSILNSSDTTEEEKAAASVKCITVIRSAVEKTHLELAIVRKIAVEQELIIKNDQQKFKDLELAMEKGVEAIEKRDEELINEKDKALERNEITISTQNNIIEYQAIEILRRDKAPMLQALENIEICEQKCAYYANLIYHLPLMKSCFIPPNNHWKAKLATANTLFSQYKTNKNRMAEIHAVIDKKFPYLEAKIFRLLEEGVCVGRENILEEATKLMKLAQLENLVNENHGNGGNCAGYRPIHWAARSANCTAIRILARIDTLNPNQENHGGYSPLHTAIYQLSCKPEKAAATVEALLLIRGIDPNSMLCTYTPLTYAIKHLRNNSLPVLKSLIARNADRNKADEYGYTPLRLAEHYDLNSSIKALLKPIKTIVGDDFYYEGSIDENGFATGLGVFVDRVNDVALTFMGHFSEGFLNGKGTCVEPTEIYTGNFTAGARDGKGILRILDGKFYEVSYVMGVREENKTKLIELPNMKPLPPITKKADELSIVDYEKESFDKIPNPESLKSKKVRKLVSDYLQINNRYPITRATVIEESGRYFDGTLDSATGKATGFGTIINATHVYVGNFLNGMITGSLGVLYNKDTNLSYIGDFHQGLKHGQGLTEKSEGHIFGQFVEDDFQEKGVWLSSKDGQHLLS